MTVSALTPSDHDDGTLARAHLDGDPEAFATLFRRYYPDLVRYVERRGYDHTRAEDVAQETLARAFRYFGGFDASRPLWPWLRTIAVRFAAVEADRRSNEVLVDEPETDRPVPGSDPLDAIAGRVTLVQALRHLPLRQRDALVMRYVEDRHPSDIAAAFGLTRTAFEQLLWRARRSLAKEYAKVCGALAPIGLRLRRATAWVDAQVQIFASSAGAMLTDAVVAAGIATVAVVVGLVSSSSVPGVTVAAPASTPAIAPPRTNTSLAHPTTARSATGQRVQDDITVDDSRSVGGTEIKTHAKVPQNPTGEGPAEEFLIDVENVPVIDYIRVGERGNNGSGPGMVCLNAPGICHPAA